MRILPVCNFSLINSKNISYNNNNTSIQNLKKNYVCDSVSFSGDNNDKKTEVEKNSLKLWNYLQDMDYQSFIQFTSTHDAKSWDPNFVATEKEIDEKICLGAIILASFNMMNMKKQEKDDAQSAFAILIQHPDFKIWVEDSTDDLMEAVINQECPQRLGIMLTNTEAFQKMPLEDKQSYYEMAIGIGKKQIANNIKKIMQNSSDETPKAKSTNGSGKKVESKVDWDKMEIDEIKEEMAHYKVDTSGLPNGFADVAGLDGIKQQLTENIIYPWSETYRDQIEKNKLDRPSSVLLSGPTGCGKTYIIQALSKETGYDMYALNLGNAGSSYAHETGNAITELFDNAEALYKKTNKPVIIFLDEIDAMARSRENADQDYAKEEVNTLLMAINNSSQRGVILVGATNLISDMDPAILRAGRFDNKIVMEYPKTREEVKPIASMYLANRPLGESLIQDIDHISDQFIGMSPASVKNVLTKAMYKAMYDGRPSADMDDFDKILADEKKSQKETQGNYKCKRRIGFRFSSDKD